MRLKVPFDRGKYSIPCSEQVVGKEQGVLGEGQLPTLH